MARKFLPELSSFDDAQNVTHYHGIHGSIYEDEWIAVKVSYDERDYLEKLKQVIEKYSFYEGEWIDTGSYSIQESEFSIDDYTVRIVVPNAATGELCGQVIAYSNQDNSIIYLFLESDSLEFTELDGIVRIIWPELLG